MVRYYSLFFLVGVYKEDSLIGTMKSFHFQGSIQDCPTLTILFNCPVFTLDYCTMKDCRLEEKDCSFKSRLSFPNKNSKIGFTSSAKKEEIIFMTYSACFVN